jgi:hypothetical protein
VVGVHRRGKGLYGLMTDLTPAFVSLLAKLGGGGVAGGAGTDDDHGHKFGCAFRVRAHA